MSSNLADKPSLANVLPPRIEKRCLEYQYTKLGRQTYCGRWPVPPNNDVYRWLNLVNFSDEVSKLDQLDR